MKWLETWRESFKNVSQWVNVMIGVVGASYLVMTDSMKADLPTAVVGLMAGAAALNIFIRNIPQKNKGH